MTTPREIENIIESAVPDSQVRVRDTAGDGNHFEAVVISARFQGMTLLEQQRLVMGAMKDALDTRVHALQLRTYTPEQWDQYRKQTPEPTEF